MRFVALISLTLNISSSTTSKYDITAAFTRYTTIEKELLSIVDTLKEYHNILLGHTIKVYTDHKNLTCVKFNTQRVIRWRMVIEDFGPEFIYVPGPTNIVADAMSRLPTNNQPKSDQINGSKNTKNRLLELADLFAAEPLPDDAYPLHFKLIQKEQVRDTSLVNYAEKNPAYSINVFHGGGNSHQLICKDGKIVIPTSLQNRIVKWYHTMLCHPGATRLEDTIRQHFTWDTLRDDVRKACKKCHTCQTTKHTKAKYGHLPVKKHELQP